MIPTRDRSAMLARTLRGALGQREVEVEVVVVDDGSTDETPAMLAAVRDARLRVVRCEQPQRVAAARNLGIDAASSDWIAFLDDDDLWAPDKLARQLEAGRVAQSDWTYCGYVRVDPTLRILEGSPPADPARVHTQLAYRNLLPAGASTVLARTSLVREVGRFDAGLTKLEDWDLWIRLAAAAPAACVEAPLVAYVEHRGMATRSTDGVLTELTQLDERYRSLRGGRSLDWRAWYRWMGWSALLSDDRVGAVDSYTRAFRSGDASSVGRTAVALISPRLGVRIARRSAVTKWAAGAENWLGAFRPADQSTRARTVFASSA